jgi:hypothetical protein
LDAVAERFVADHDHGIDGLSQLPSGGQGPKELAAGAISHVVVKQLLRPKPSCGVLPGKLAESCKRLAGGCCEWPKQQRDRVLRWLGAENAHAGSVGKQWVEARIP